MMEKAEKVDGISQFYYYYVIFITVI